MAFPKFLRIAVVPLPSLISLNQTEDGEYKIIGGPEGKVVENLAQAFKCSYKILPAPDKAWGNLVNGTWTGAIGMIVRNEADIGISKFGISEKRQEYVDYSYPYIIEDITFALHKPGLRSPIDSLTHPFTYELWLAVAIAIIVMTIAYALFHNISVVNSLMQIFGVLTFQSVGTANKSLKDMFMLSSWVFGGMFLAYSYVAVLLSFLTVPLMERGVRNADELSSAILAGTHKATVFRGGMTLSGLLMSQKDVIQKIAQHIQKNNYSIEPKRQVIIEALSKEKIALIGPRSSLEFFLQTHYFISDDSLDSFLAAIVMSKSFCCKDEVNTFIHTYFASGIHQKEERDKIFIAGLKSDSIGNAATDDAADTQTKSLSVIDMSGAFILMIMGQTLAFVVAICEIFYFKCCVKPKRKNLRKHVKKGMLANILLS